jgi:Flp pilus assembly protein TadD
MKGRARFLLIVAFAAMAGFAAPGVFAAADTDDRQAEDTDVSSANKAIKDKDWNKAIEHLTRAAARDGKNADLYNKLGYAERKRGNLEAAFKHYDRALALNPKHRGAHEYIGEAYLMSGNLAKAEEHLAALDKLCTFSCEEYRDLKTAIAEYKQKQATGKK